MVREPRCIVQHVSKYLLISGVAFGTVSAALAWYGFHFIDVPEPAIWFFFIGVPLFIVSIVLIAVSGVLWATKRGRLKAL